MQFDIQVGIQRFSVFSRKTLIVGGIKGMHGECFLKLWAIGKDVVVHEWGGQIESTKNYLWSI